MTEITNRFSISELQSLLIFFQFGSGISDLIREIENPASQLLNPNSRGKFRNMLPRLRDITAAEEQTLKEFSEACGAEILRTLQRYYPSDTPDNN